MLKAQDLDITRKTGELSTLFSTLDEKGKDSVLCILRTLDFAQSTLYPAEKQHTFNKSETGG